MKHNRLPRLIFIYCQFRRNFNLRIYYFRSFSINFKCGKKTIHQSLREKVFSNMSQRAGEMLREDLEAKGMVRVSEVEAQQKEILKIVRRLADEGQIVIGGQGDEGYV